MDLRVSEKRHINWARGRTTEYYLWLAMLSRCYSPKSTNYPKYGAKGITVCPAWKNYFSEFMKDMGLRPSPQHALDRIDSTKGYYPGNVRWATLVEATPPRPTYKMLTYRGETRSCKEWEEILGWAKLGFKPGTLRDRVFCKRRPPENVLEELLGLRPPATVAQRRALAKNS